MTQHLTDTAGGQAALAEALAKAVPAWIETIAGLPGLTRAVMRAQVEAELAEADLAGPPHWGDPGDDASWETLGAFQALAKSLALDAYRPGGVTYLGMHWEATRAAALGAATAVRAAGDVL